MRDGPILAPFRVGNDGLEPACGYDYRVDRRALQIPACISGLLRLTLGGGRFRRVSANTSHLTKSAELGDSGRSMPTDGAAPHAP